MCTSPPSALLASPRPHDPWVAPAFAPWALGPHGLGGSHGAVFGNVLGPCEKTQACHWKRGDGGQGRGMAAEQGDGGSRAAAAATRGLRGSGLPEKVRSELMPASQQAGAGRLRGSRTEAVPGGLRPLRGRGHPGQLLRAQPLPPTGRSPGPGLLWRQI